MLDWLLNANSLQRLGAGLEQTVKISLLALVFSSLLGLGFGLLLRSRWRILRWPARFYLETIRIVPLLVWLFLLFYGLPQWTGWHLSGFWVCVLVFSGWGLAEMGDLLRGALDSIDRHQRDTGRALGLSDGQIFWLIEAPQALRRLLPGAINLATRLIKTTSLGYLVSVVELVMAGQTLIENTLVRGPGTAAVPNASLWVYGLIFIIYFLICYPLSRWAARLEQRWN